MATKTEGIIDEATGELKDAVGAILDDPAMRISGKAKALCGESRQLMADAAIVARDVMSENPLLVLGATAAIGFVLGALWASGRN